MDSYSMGKNAQEVIDGTAVYEARAVYPDSEDLTISDPVSTLPYGVQWDATVNFIAPNYAGILKNSSSFGNYSSGIVPTGSNPNYALNNIYDLAGNVYEWTMEVYDAGYSKMRAVRGGRYGTGGSDNPIGVRYMASPNSSDTDYYGFRIALYVK